MQTLEESVLVTAERLKAEVETQRALTPGGVTVVEGDELYQRHVNNIADMLRYVPGVFAESGYGNDELFFSSRGSNLDAVDYDKNGVKLLQDGLPVTTADGNNHNRVIDPLTARYASVARGANALTYGASTLGGAIDFISPTARNSAPLSLFFDGGSFGSLNGRVTLGGVRDKVDGLLTVEGRHWDGYRDHSDQERWGLYANAGWQPSATTNVQLFGDLRQQRPAPAGRAHARGGGRRSRSGERRRARRQLREGREDRARRGQDDLVPRRERVAVGRSLVRRAVAVSPDREPDPRGLRRAGTESAGGGVQPADRHRPSRSRRDGALRPARRHARPARRAQLRQGVGGRRQLSQPQRTAERHSANPTTATPTAWRRSSMDRWRASDRWTAVFGAQVVSAARDVLVTNATTGAVTNPDARYTTVNPRAGVIASLNEAGEVYGNVSRLFEAPTTFQIDRSGARRQRDARSHDRHRGRSRLALQGRASRKARAWTWDIAAYYARISDEILSLDDPNAPGNSLVTNIDKTTHAGLEALVGSSFSRRRHASYRAAGQRHAQSIPLRRRSRLRRRTACPPRPRTPRAARCCTGMPAASMPAPPSISSASAMRTSPIPTPSIATD